MTAMSRRGLFRGAALAGATTVFGGAVVTLSGEQAYAATPVESVIVVVSLRGAADGLSLVVPHADPAYYAARPSIAIPSGSLLAKDGFFGLHPALAPLLPMWNAGTLAAVHAAGLPAPNRSHFAAMEAVEDADPGSTDRVGWLNRVLGADAFTSPLNGVAFNPLLPTSLIGPEPALSMASLEQSLAGNAAYQPGTARSKSLATMWGSEPSSMGAGMRSTLSTTPALGTALAQPDRSSTYGSSDIGRALSSVARTLKAEIGVSLVTVDQGDWDMHTTLGTATKGPMLDNTTSLATAIAAFFTDLGALASKVTLVTISEFGRRVQENASGGLDHGWGNVMFLAGAGVKGGKYYGRWSGLQNTLDADVPVTTDYRSVLAEVVASRTKASTAAVFPGLTRERVGVMLGQ
ncbi:MAG: DUF1501 domain-containing protein [Actinobacteria bacterium]|nr:DUF1501 domain-containing protein [Actinomycetota bacterium]